MSVNAISSLGSTSATSQLGGAHRHGGGGAFGAVSSVLGMSAQEIAGEVSSGKSLDELAKAQGVSHADLVSALKDGMPDDLKSRSDVDQIAETMATQKGMPTQGPGGTPPAGGPPMGPPPLQSLNGIGDSTGVLTGTLTDAQQTLLDSLSSVLETTSDDLLTDLRSGTSLADLLKDKGVDASRLADVLQNGLMFDTNA